MSLILFEDLILSSLILVVAVASMVISLKLLDFPDLSIDGVYALGGAVSASLIATNSSPLTALVLALAAGFLAGSFVGLLHSYLQIGKLMAGILALGILYSLNLLVLGGSQLGILYKVTIFEPVWLQFLQAGRIGTRVSAALMVVFFLSIFLIMIIRSKIGLILRACGSNYGAATARGIRTRIWTTLGMGLAGALSALAGSMDAQLRGGADVRMGFGMIVTALAALLLGTSLLRGIIRLISFIRKEKLSTYRFDLYLTSMPAVVLMLLACLLGSLIYQAILLTALRVGLWQGGVRSLTSIIVIGSLFLLRGNAHLKGGGLL